MNHSSRFGSGGDKSSEVLCEDGERIWPLAGSRQIEKVVDLPLAIEAAGRDRVG
jgi:hypothetical protein